MTRRRVSFQEALAAQPERLDALVGLGIARFKQGAFDEAVESLQRVVAQRPEMPRPRGSHLA